MDKTIITIPERRSLRAITTKYLANRIGFNIRANDPYFVEKDKTWIVTCKAHLTNYVSNLDKRGKQFTYTFDNIGQFVYSETEGKYQAVSRPLKSEIDKEVSNRYIRLTNEIEKRLLISGSNSWGKLTLVKYFLSPLYSMVSKLLDIGFLSMSEISSEQNYKFFRLLLNSGYVIVNPKSEDIFEASNELKKLAESETSKTLELYGCVENVVGIIFGNHYDEIKTNLGIRPPSSYVDTTKSYYFDALRYGELIKTTEKDLIDSLQSFNIYIGQDKYLNFRKSLIELSSTDLLSKEGDYYIGNQEILDNMSYLQSDLVGQEMVI